MLRVLATVPVPIVAVPLEPETAFNTTLESLQIVADDGVITTEAGNGLTFTTTGSEVLLQPVLVSVTITA